MPSKGKVGGHVTNDLPLAIVSFFEDGLAVGVVELEEVFLTVMGWAQVCDDPLPEAGIYC